MKLARPAIRRGARLCSGRRGGGRIRWAPVRAVTGCMFGGDAVPLSHRVTIVIDGRFRCVIGEQGVAVLDVVEAPNDRLGMGSDDAPQVRKYHCR